MEDYPTAAEDDLVRESASPPAPTGRGFWRSTAFVSRGLVAGISSKVRIRWGK